MIQAVANFFQSGGPLMWALLILLASAVAVTTERVLFYLRTCRVNADAVVTEVVTHLNKGDLDAAIEILDAQTGPTSVILTRAVERYLDGLTIEEIRSNVEEVAIREVPRFSKRLNYLSMLANIATLSGLLGTIFGLQQSFSSLALAEAAAKAAVLADGISQAMNTTAFGLIIAIPCMIAYTRLSNMQAQRTEECDAATIRLLNYLDLRIACQDAGVPSAAINSATI